MNTTNYRIYHNELFKELIVRKINYNCNSYDAIWTGSCKGVGVISYNPNNQMISFNKLHGTNPYWWQVLSAAMSMVPPQEYIRDKQRDRPFKINIKEGQSGALHIFMDTYYKNTTMNIYIKDGRSTTMDISASEKIKDGMTISFGDLVEIGRVLSNYYEVGFSRNPRWWKRGSKDLWRFERLRPFEVVDDVDYDPDNK